MEDAVIKVRGVSKKFSRNIRSLMKYGFYDITRNIVGLNVNSGNLRPEEFWSVDNVSFELRKGEILGLIGRNGSGKSTMLKMLNGIYLPDRGKIEIREKVGALIDVGAGFHNLLTGRENIYVNGAILGMKKKEIDKKFDEIVKFAEIEDFLDSPTRNYSSGMYVRLGFSIVVHSNPEILLIDELLAVGDIGFQAKCFDKIGELKNNGASIILVTHNMYKLRSAYPDRAILFNKGKIEFQGEVSKAIEQYNTHFNTACAYDTGKVINPTDDFSVSGIKFLPEEDLNPGDTLTVKLDYESRVDLNDVEIDIKMNKGNRIYFRATNRSYDKIINIKKGKGSMEIGIHNIQINNFNPILSITIWKQKREGILFHIENKKINMLQVNLCSSENFLELSFN
ncbi:MAG TPA: ABC transporter ATP-binding protein [Candidatus Methanoperedens sp.]